MDIILIGTSGAMGKTIINSLAQNPDHQVVAGLQAETVAQGSFPIYNNFDDLKAAVKEGEVKAQVIIDFSTPALTEDLLDFARASNLPLVLATTGQNADQIAMIQKVSQDIPILDTHNTSIGVSVMAATLKQMAAILYPLGYDIEIIEKHHRYKKDAPSGTALMLKSALEAGIPDQTTTIYGREGLSSGRPHQEIAIHAIRGGDIVGEHTVIFANNQETIELTHRAGDKALFAKGAIHCADFLIKQGPGLYDMQAVMAQS
ncbi:TPA: 4-hydroxy-tetrahydrodipicolinate reductase [Streptococcus suis]